ncbi:MAG TPA: FG-GAP-like repeat-containing protein [Candidatus Cloacimonadota bacterium]|nr:FG-GAP-like repeat-containing protein [Candidatus Cloacimonadota bacterium]
MTNLLDKLKISASMPFKHDAGMRQIKGINMICEFLSTTARSKRSIGTPWGVGVLQYSLMIILLWVITSPLIALNDMPQLAELQGEHNMSYYGFDIVSIDFNHDDYDDLVVLSYAYGYQYEQSPSRGKVYIYYGGPGFSSASEPAMTLEGDYPEGMRRHISSIWNVGDVSGDGYEDLVIGDSIPHVSESSRYMYFFGGTDDLLTPNRIECPQAEEEFVTTYKLGDVDGDGFGDVGICYSINYHLYFDIMWGGSFIRQSILDPGFSHPSSEGSIIGIGDINNDGYNDFSIGYLEPPQGYDRYSTVRVYYGNDSRVYSDYTLLIHTASNNTTWTCKPLGDVNNDGFDDFLGYIDNSGMKVWFGSNSILPVSPSVSLNPILYGSRRVRGINHGDFNGDGFSDVVGASYNWQQFAIWLGSTSMDGFADWQESRNIENFGYAVAVGDFGGDGYDDIAVSAPLEVGIWPGHDFRGYVYVYAGNPDMVSNEDQHTPHLTEQLRMNIGPNPVVKDGEVNISIYGSDLSRGMPVHIEVFNLKGQVIYQSFAINKAPNESVSTIHLSDLPSGVYLCRAKIGNMSTCKKISITK